MKPAFRRSQTANASGVSLQGYVPASYTKLKSLYGDDHILSDDGKVSTEWVFVNVDTGDPVTLYDYKMTNLHGEGFMSVEQFRSLPEYDWHVGAHNKNTADEFIAWLLGELHTK
jgi:hypothetical protein